MKALTALLVVLCTALSAPAVAQPVLDRVVREMRAEGWSDLRARRTLLGRIRVTGDRGSAEREVVVDPSSGVVLRDYVRSTDAGGGGGTGGGFWSGGARGGGADDRDDDDRDDEDDRGGRDDDSDDSDDDGGGRGGGSGGGGGDDDGDDD